MKRSSRHLLTPARRAIDLQISGGPLMLQGHFAQWMPIAMVTEAPEDGTAQILFDATSAGTATGNDLFSFKSTRVRQVGPNTYAARGSMRFGTRSRQIEAMIQAPEGHSPFVFISFPIDPGKDAAFWTEVGVMNAPSQMQPDGDGVALQMRPQAWLRPPVLAAA